ncbi:DUF2065 domain-containing protein [Cognatilysobacter bugurensis]|uniref:DUF2065 family protein n=1 Tax=Cognatilysobacter bugurensis TaxID=543356 RepID=A0A918SSC6_9GAMM|nr:DUF2065 family protein [Lysobacter bugurensis]GHA69045.1 hypothetical protein GCM10007067_01180 [Lysobacter bugurensis]
MSELWSALALVAVLEGLFLFVAPGGWKRAAEQLYAMPNARLRVVGLIVVVLGLLALFLIRG